MFRSEAGHRHHIVISSRLVRLDWFVSIGLSRLVRLDWFVSIVPSIDSRRSRAEVVAGCASLSATCREYVSGDSIVDYVLF
jgi:hypothetical protein